MRSLHPLVPIGELLAQPLANGRSVPTADTGFPVLRLTALRNGILDTRERKTGRWTKGEALQHLIKQGDFLIARGNGSLDKVGRGALVIQEPDEVAFPDTMIRIRTLERKILPEFLALMWNSPAVRNQIESQARTTAGIYKINQTHLKAVLVPVPLLGEQRHILAAVKEQLRTIQSATGIITTNRVRIEALRRQLIQAAISGHTSPEVRKPWALPDLGLHDGRLPDIPESWLPARLADIADVVGGVTKDAKKQSGPGHVVRPYLRVANVQRGRLDLEHITEIKVTEKKATQLELRHGDLLLNEGGDRDKLARGWVWEGQIPRCIHQNHVFRARIRPGVIDPYFLSFLANSIGGEWAERNGKQSVNLASISLSKIKQMPVVVPPFEESQRIARQLIGRLADLNRLDQALDSALTRADSLRGSILTAAFEGRMTGKPMRAAIVPDLPSSADLNMTLEAL